MHLFMLFVLTTNTDKIRFFFQTYKYGGRRHNETDLQDRVDDKYHLIDSRKIKCFAFLHIRKIRPDHP